MQGYAVHLARQFQDGSEHWQRVFAVATLLHEFYNILKEHDMFFPEHVQSRLAQKKLQQRMRRR